VSTPHDLALAALMVLVFCVLLLVCWLVAQVAELRNRVADLESLFPRVEVTVRGSPEPEPSTAPHIWPTFPPV